MRAYYIRCKICSYGEGIIVNVKIKSHHDLRYYDCGSFKNYLVADNEKSM